MAAVQGRGIQQQAQHPAEVDAEARALDYDAIEIDWNYVQNLENKMDRLSQEVGELTERVKETKKKANRNVVIGFAAGALSGAASVALIFLKYGPKKTQS